jgi:hypothetical protein
LLKSTSMFINLTLHLKFIGILLIFLAFVHIIFPKYFRWEKELANLSLINRQLMYVHTFFIALVVLLMGIFCFSAAEELQTTALGRQFSLGLGIFWGFRLLFQFFVYSPKLWWGKKFETFVHILFSILWIYLTSIFFMVYAQ